MARIDTLRNFLTDVANAIKAKKGDNTPIQASNFDTEIANLPSGGSADFEINDASYLFYGEARLDIINDLLPLVKNPSTMGSMFYNCKSLTTLNLSNFDTSKVTNMRYMFYSCSKLANLDLSNFDTSSVTKMEYMFYDCTSLTELDVSNFDTSNVTNMSYMFAGSEATQKLIKIKGLDNFDTSNVTNMSGMFQALYEVTSLDLSNFDTSNVTNMSNMFSKSRTLNHIDIRNFTFTKVTSYTNMFNRVLTDCLIIVKDDEAKEWITSKFSTLTNVKTVAEYEG